MTTYSIAEVREAGKVSWVVIRTEADGSKHWMTSHEVRELAQAEVDRLDAPIPITRERKRPRDPNQLAKMIVDLATGAAEEDLNLVSATDSDKDSAAVALGRKGGLKGGAARAASLSSEQRKEIARKAAAKRWNR